MDRILQKVSTIELTSLSQEHGSHCGYCDKGEYYSVGLVAQNILTKDYQKMMDMGWRRCGNYYYVPTNRNKACCQLYSIRMDTTHYKMRKSHRKVLRRFNQFLESDKMPQENKEQKPIPMEVQKEKMAPLDEDQKWEIERITAILRKTAEREFKEKAKGDAVSLIKTHPCKSAAQGLFYSNFLLVIKGKVLEKSKQNLAEFLKEVNGPKLVSEVSSALREEGLSCSLEEKSGLVIIKRGPPRSTFSCQKIEDEEEEKMPEAGREEKEENEGVSFLITSRIMDLVLRLTQKHLGAKIDDPHVEKIELKPCRKSSEGICWTNMMEVWRVHLDPKASGLSQEEYRKQSEDVIRPFFKSTLPDFQVSIDSSGTIFFKNKKKKEKGGDFDDFSFDEENSGNLFAQNQKRPPKGSEDLVMSLEEGQKGLSPLLNSRILDLLLQLTRKAFGTPLEDPKMAGIVLKPCKNKRHGDCWSNIIEVWHEKIDKNAKMSGSLQNYLKKMERIFLPFFQSTLLDFSIKSLPNGRIYFRQKRQGEDEMEEEKERRPLSFGEIEEENAMTSNEISKTKEKEVEMKSGDSGAFSGELIRPLGVHSITKEIVPARFEEESFEIYSRYCKAIHNDKEVTEKSYTSFLCTPNLIASKVTGKNPGDPELLLGCYHVKYYLDGKLFAVGVVDVTENALSSVYFFYDPKYKALNIGIIGSLWEIEFIQEMNKEFPDFKYYYLGFYVHNSKKMVYKGDYEPCELLCPEKKSWHEKNSVLPKVLAKSNSLSEASTPICPDVDFRKTDKMEYLKEKMRIYTSGRFFKLRQLTEVGQMQIAAIFSSLLNEIGKPLLESLVFVV